MSTSGFRKKKRDYSGHLQLILVYTR